MYCNLQQISFTHTLVVQRQKHLLFAFEMFTTAVQHGQTHRNTLDADDDDDAAT